MTSLNTSSVFQQKLIESASSISFKVLARPTDYSVSCEANFTNSSSAGLNILSHSVAYTISGDNQTHVTVHGLLPSTLYNCCLSDSLLTECAIARTGSNNDGLSPTSSGVLGAFLGVLLTVLIALTVIAIVVSAMVTVKRKR